MEPTIVKKTISVSDMTCTGCETRIEKKLNKLDGIHSAKASYNSGKVEVGYDKSKTSLSHIRQAIHSLGYQVAGGDKNPNPPKNKLSQVAFIAVILLGVSVLLNQFGGFAIFNQFPQATENTSYLMLFVIGLLTSVHCIAMCGGINLSQCAGRGAVAGGSTAASLRPSILYNAGRVVSYTVIGGIVGAVGSVVSFSGVAKGIVAVLAGVFMIIMGLNMLDLFPWLRKFSLRMPKFLTSGIDDQKKSNSPFYVGLLNGFMPCGPLQAMQLYALSTGSPVKGALSMLLFSLGTVPLMFGFGAISTMLSRKFTAKIMSVSAVLVIFLGVFMLNNGLSLSGIMVFGGGNPPVVAASSDSVQVVDGVQTVAFDLSPRAYAPITVKKDVPVRWIITAEAQNINGCNNEIIVPAYGISQKLVPGENIIEFTPTEAGTVPYSCWMGMIRNKITVID